MAKKKVDIIIPAYNPGIWIRKAVQSCLNQTYHDHNVIVVDDGSDFDVAELLRPFSQVRILRMDKNSGPSAARNFGILNSDAEFISFLDADDIFHKNKLQLSVLKLQNKKDIAMTCGNYRVIHNRNNLLKPFYRTGIDVNYNNLLRQNYVASGSVTVRRRAIEAIGLFDESLRIAEDYDCWIRIAERFKISYIHEVLYYYSVVPKENSLTNRSDLKLEHLNNLKYIKNNSKKRMGII